MTTPSIEDQELFDQRPADTLSTGRALGELAETLASWSDRPTSPATLARLVRPLASQVADDTPSVTSALRTGDLPAAQAAALDAILSESDPAKREARRAGCAWALSRVDGEAAAALFADGRTAGRLENVGHILHVALYKGRRAWEVGLIERLFRHADPAMRLAAISAQIGTARANGLPDPSVRRLMMAALAEPQAARFGRNLADLIWTTRRYSLVQPLFGRCGRLIEDAPDDPLLAFLLRASAWHRVPSTHRASIGASAGRLARVEDATRRFWRRLADPKLPVAVVGNSPCEEGGGRGPEIDRHAVVVRFNDGPEDGRFADDYGARCDAKVFSVRNVKRPTTRTSAPCVIFRRQLHIVRSNMALTERFQREGAEVVYLPAAPAQELRVQLGSPASTGLAFLAQVRAVRGSLSNVSCFGFSMTDQIEPGARSHYFNQAVAFEGHAWRAERELFEAWTAGR